MSASTIPTLNPFLQTTAVLEAIVDFPTPPFPETMAMVFLIFGNIL